MKTLPLSTSTKDTLDAIRPRGQTYDQVLRAILETRPVGEWRELLEDKPSRAVATVLSNMARKAGAPSMKRDPSEQVLLAESARQRWQMWQSAGRLEARGERRWAYRTGPAGGDRVRIKRVR